MHSSPEIRDYSLTGAESGPGFKPEQWYSTPIPRKRLKSLMKRSDKRAALNCGMWLAAMLVSGAVLVSVWGTFWAWPTALVYGVFYGSGGDSRWHEFGHGTAFRTRWINEVFYQ